MARGINKVILVGNLGADPELRYTGSGTAVCNFRIATTESYKDRDGNQVETTEWHTIVAWSRLAEICGEYLKKGRQVYVEGALQTRQWEDKEGNTRYTTEVKAREMQMLGGPGGGGGSDDFDQSERGAGSGSGARDSGGSGGGGGRSGGSRDGGGSPRPPQRQAQPADSYDDGGGAFGPNDDLPF